MSNGLRLAVVAAIVAVLGLGGVAAAQRFGGPDAPPPKPSPARDDAKPASKQLDLGDFAKISPNYRVTVSDVTLYEGGENQFVAATVKVKYTGTEDGEPWADLIVEFTTADANTFDESSCPIDIGEASEQPSLKPGDVETYPVCIDVPTGDLEGGKVSIEEAFADDGDRVDWSTEGAEKKTAPAPAAEPEPSSGQVAPAPQQRQQPADNDDSDNRRYDSDDVDEYREKLDDAIEKYEKQRDRIKAQLRAWDKLGYEGDAVDDYEDWLDDVEDALETYKKQRDALPD
jgi:uncharacterized protein YukE